VTSPTVRAAVYTVFAACFIARSMAGAALRFAKLCVAYGAGACVYAAAPRYDHDVIRQRSAPGRAAPLVDVSEQAAATFPDGTHAAFSRHAAQVETLQTTLRARAAGAFARRELHARAQRRPRRAGPQGELHLSV
jgi:hypothetical protein